MVFGNFQFLFCYYFLTTTGNSKFGELLIQYCENTVFFRVKKKKIHFIHLVEKMKRDCWWWNSWNVWSIIEFVISLGNDHARINVAKLNFNKAVLFFLYSYLYSINTSYNNRHPGTHIAPAFSILRFLTHYISVRSSLSLHTSKSIANESVTVFVLAGHTVDDFNLTFYADISTSLANCSYI